MPKSSLSSINFALSPSNSSRSQRSTNAGTPGVVNVLDRALPATADLPQSYALGVCRALPMPFEGDGGDLGAGWGVAPGDAAAVDGAAGWEGFVELDGGGVEA
jgi:hypothetical protein